MFDVDLGIVCEGVSTPGGDDSKRKLPVSALMKSFSSPNTEILSSEKEREGA